MSDLYVQIATLEIYPSHIAAYRIAVAEQAKAAIEKESGVLSLNAVANNDDSTRITVFEIYRDRAAYESHLKAEHFLKYKAAVESMVKSLTLTPVSPVALAAKSHV
jgi:quinol monooxygenase YgiN